MRRAEPGGVAAENAAGAAEAKLLGVVAQQRAGFDSFVDEQHIGRAARQSFDAERAGAGKQIKHARIGDRIAIAVGENIEQRFAQPVGGRAQSFRRLAVALRSRDRARAQASADDTHHSLLRGTSISARARESGSPGAE
jgi:hypothetical protein